MELGVGEGEMVLGVEEGGVIVVCEDTDAERVDEETYEDGETSMLMGDMFQWLEEALKVEKD